MHHPTRILLLLALLTACRGPAQDSPPTWAPLDPSARVEESLSGPILDAFLSDAPIELVSLEPSFDLDEEESDQGTPPSKDSGLHGHTLLGSTLLIGDARQIALGAVFAGIDGSDGSVADCFEPRHALRVEHGGETFEIVLCFECLSMRTYRNGERVGSALTSEEPGGALNAILRIAGVEVSEY